MYVVYEHFEDRRNGQYSCVYYGVYLIPYYVSVSVKVPKQFKGSLLIYRGSLSSSSMDSHSCSTVILRVALPGRNMRNNLTLDITTSSRVARRLRSDYRYSETERNTRLNSCYTSKKQLTNQLCKGATYCGI